VGPEKYPVTVLCSHIAAFVKEGRMGDTAN